MNRDEQQKTKFQHPPIDWRFQLRLSFEEGQDQDLKKGKTLRRNDLTSRNGEHMEPLQGPSVLPGFRWSTILSTSTGLSEAAAGHGSSIGP